MLRKTICLLTLVSATLLIGGCVPPATGLATNQQSRIGKEPEIAALLDRIDAVLERNRTGRMLDVEVNGAWQILHGILAYGDDCPLLVDGQVHPSALRYLLEGGPIMGFEPFVGHTFEVPGQNGEIQNRPGLVTVLAPVEKIGQGHTDQWLAVLSQCDLSPDDTIQTAVGTFTMADWVRQVGWDVPRNPYHEYSWTVIAMANFLQSSDDWQAVDGQVYDLESL
ncbi:MAG: hypothetical protein AAFP90_11460, partial [Planctomycetota bacterium]